jgi:hypothetical protein
MPFPPFLTLEKLASSPNKLITVFLLLCYESFLLPGGFFPGTLIRTYDGRCVPIEKLDLTNRCHQQVLSANLTTKSVQHFFCCKNITKIRNHSVQEHIELVIEGEKLNVATDQKFFSMDGSKRDEQ